MGQERAPWAPPVEMSGGAVGHLSARENSEADGTGRAWVSWVQETGGRHVPTVVQVRAASLRPLEPPGACQQVLRRLRGLGGKRDAG
jgi:hypothetical protein